MESGLAMTDSILLQHIIYETNQDENLSQLPDEFKEAAIEIMFLEEQARRRALAGVEEEEVFISNKRSRSNDSSMMLDEQ